MGDFLIGEVVEVGQDDHRAELLGERAQRVLDILAKRALHDISLGAVVERRILTVEEELLDRAQVVGIEDLSLFLFAPIFIDERIGQNREEPGAAIGALLEAIPVIIRLQIGLLDQVLGVALILGIAKRAGVELVDILHGGILKYLHLAAFGGGGFGVEPVDFQHLDFSLFAVSYLEGPD